MRLVIKQCRFCILPKDECEHYQKMKAAIAPVDIVGTIVHSCPKYYGTIPIGSHVEIELKEIEFCESSDFQEADQPEWISAGMATGTIISTSNWKVGFFIVKLDKPAKLVIPERDQGMHTAEEREVEIRMKRGKDIKILHRATPEETEAFLEKERQEIEEMLA